ncbi:MAG: thioredoxin family protein, partial [Verrucomicrobiota bacterium]
MKFPTKTFGLAATALLAFSYPAIGADGWVTDFAAAKKTAEAEKKDLLMDFTGSDWCGWCIKLKEEVFSKEAFKKEAPNHFVLVELDYPRQTEQDPATKAQNEKLRTEYAIQGYPTIYLADSKGTPYARTGYQPGGSAAYLPHLSELRQVREKRDAAMTEAAKAEGLEKAKLLAKALETMEPEIVEVFYKPTVTEI